MLRSWAQLPILAIDLMARIATEPPLSLDSWKVSAYPESGGVKIADGTDRRPGVLPDLGR